MTEELKKTIEEEIRELPKEGQDAIGAVDWVKIAEEIGKKFLLNEDEINSFQLETLLVLIGVVYPDFYAINIENHVNRTKDESGKMADEAFEKIFTPIGKTLEENIKKNLGSKNISWEQTVDFILSGGNYFAFIAPTPETPNRDKGNTPAHNASSIPDAGGNTLLGRRSMQDIKDKLIP